MLAELNKVAIIHLFLLGFEEEIENFTLGLTNTSTQAELLKNILANQEVLAQEIKNLKLTLAEHLSTALF
jgi:hypothetical protein